MGKNMQFGIPPWHQFAIHPDGAIAIIKGH
jgi:hypothetical protein